MKQKVAVVIFGNAAAGKSTLAEMVATHLHARGITMRLAFADPLKEAALHLLGIPHRVSYATADVKESFQAYGKTARRWLQWLGTEIGRNQIHEDVWVHRAADRFLADPAVFAVISDGRFENERTKLAPYLREYVGADTHARVVNVLIYRPGMPVNTTHPSESEVYNMRLRAGREPLFDRVICNDKTLEALDDEARRLAEYIERELTYNLL